jgi:DNA-binding transcriptional regulator YdaS (Cro superfamily)
MVEWKGHLQRAIEHFGSQPVLAREIGCSQSKISWLLQKAEKIDAEDAVAIERVTGGQVTKTQLRPDLWPSEPQRVAS